MANPDNFFKSGNKGKPKGAVAKVIPKHAREFNKKQLAKIFSKIMHMTVDEVDDWSKKPERILIELIACKLLAKATKTGDVKIMEFIMDRTIGKVPKAEDEKNENEEEDKRKLAQVIITLPSNGREKE